jgi:hypothetical protein
LNKSRGANTASAIHVDQISSEGAADTFAMRLLLKTTIDIMAELKSESFDIRHYIYEMVIFLQIVMLINQCSRIAQIASSTEPDEDVRLELVAYPIAVTARMLMQRQYLDLAVANYLFKNPSDEQMRLVEQQINSIVEMARKRAKLVDSGFAKASEFSLFPARRQNEWALLEQLRKEIAKDGGLARKDLEDFCNLAEELNKDGKILHALRCILRNPNEPVAFDVKGDLCYIVPWVKGPNGQSRPFGLDTKYGHLVFVFVEQKELCEIFIQESAQMLMPGFEIETAIVLVSHADRLAPELAARMPRGQRFGLIIQGSEDFNRYMEELAADSIWP